MSRPPQLRVLHRRRGYGVQPVVGFQPCGGRCGGADGAGHVQRDRARLHAGHRHRHLPGTLPEMGPWNPASAMTKTGDNTWSATLEILDGTRWSTSTPGSWDTVEWWEEIYELLNRVLTVDYGTDADDRQRHRARLRWSANPADGATGVLVASWARSARTAPAKTVTARRHDLHADRRPEHHEADGGHRDLHDRRRGAAPVDRSPGAPCTMCTRTAS